MQLQMNEKALKNYQKRKVTESIEIAADASNC